jgi:hypothetical protein
MNSPVEPAIKIFVSWQTSLYDGQSHAITDEEFAFGPGRDSGHFEAVCGHNLCMGDSFVPPGKRCRSCVLLLRAQSSMRPLQQRLTAQRGHVCRRLLAVLKPGRARHAR